MAGQGTVALELLADHDLDVVLVPVGGGGLIAGVATVALVLIGDLDDGLILGSLVTAAAAAPLLTVAERRSGAPVRSC